MSLPRPAAILMVSAHWMSDVPTVNATVSNTTIHDFGGFPAQLYQLQYAAPGAPNLAGRVQSLLGEQEITCRIDTNRGLDHGAWVPLMHMYPQADIPVAQLSIQYGQKPAWHWRIGECLRSLRDQGVLIIASGGMTHNLRDADFNAPDGQTYPYALDFQRWMHEKLIAGDKLSLLEYRDRAPGAIEAHPHDDHLLPLFVARGAASGLAERLFAGISLAAFALDVWRFD